jgi:hypothetical protein
MPYNVYMQPFKFILVLGLLLIAGYFGFVAWRASTIPPTISMQNYNVVKDLPPTQCTYSWTDGANSSVSGALYELGSITRYDFTINNVGKATLVHMIVDQDDQAVAWNDHDSVGVKGTYESLASRTGLALASQANCKPWWIPDFSLHIIPTDVSFSQTQ